MAAVADWGQSGPSPPGKRLRRKYGSDVTIFDDIERIIRAMLLKKARIFLVGSKQAPDVCEGGLRR